MSVDVLVCVCFNGPGGGSEMLTAMRRFAVAPQIGDYIELLPESTDASDWCEPVARRWLRTAGNDPQIEVHVELPRRNLPPEAEADLRAAGYREPAGDWSTVGADMAAADEDLAAGRTRSAADVFDELDGR